MRPIVPTVVGPDNLDPAPSSPSRRHSFTSSGAHLPQPRYISRPDDGLVLLFGQPDAQEHCRSTGISWLNTETGEVVPQRCRRNTCLNSTRREVERLAAAIALAEPDTMFRYACIPETWAEAQKRINRVHEYLRRAGREVRVGYAIEHNPAGTGCHVHGFMYGDPVDDILGLSLEKVGLGDHHLQEITHAGRLGYPMKQAQHSQRSLDDYLQVNGGTLIHTSRGFWRDGRGGSTLTRRDAAQKGWRRLHPPDPRWVRVRTGAWVDQAAKSSTGAHRSPSGRGTPDEAVRTARSAA